MTSDKILYKHEDPHGTGEVFFVWQNGGSANLLASTGSDGTVAIFNRQGHLEERITLHGLCCGFAWDFEGDNLAIITSNSSQVTLWDSNDRQKHIIDTGLRDPLSCILWAKSSPLMAVGTARGNLAIYNHQTSKRFPILGKHTKRIVCGSWSKENVLALGSEDKHLSVSTEDVDLLRTVALRDVPSDMQFAEMKTDERIPGENTVSMIIGKKTLYLYHLPEPESPSELGFQPKYGSLLQHKWFGDGYILLGFSNGYCIAISTHPKEVGQELWQVKNHRYNLTAIAVCNALEQVASCGDNNIKVHSTANLQETVNILNLNDQSGARNISWSNDGQLLGVSTSQGSLTVFVTKLPLLSAISPPRIALLSSLAEVHMLKHNPDKKHKCTYCTSQFVHRHHLENHIRTHTKESPFLCNFCGKTFRGDAALRTHLSIHDPKMYPRRYQYPQKIIVKHCTLCDYSSIHGNLKKHMINVHGRGGGVRKLKKFEFSCHICDKEFRQSTSLMNHLRIHSEVRDYHCSYCKASFQKNHYLRLHIDGVHLNKRPNKCDQCDISFPMI